MMVNQNPNTGLVGIITVLLIAGLMMGLALSNADLLNPNRSAAEARMRDLELQTEAQIATVRIAEAKRLSDLKVRLTELSYYVWLGVGGVSTLSVSVGLTTFLILYGRSRLVVAKMPVPPTAGTWRDPVWREEQIRIAREHARASRQGGTPPKPVPVGPNNGNGHH